jgi:hypothetical protein
MKFLGSESKVSKKGNAYVNSLWQQGTETITTMLPTTVNPQNLSEGNNYQLTFDFKTRYKQLDLLNVIEAPKETK